MNKEQIKKECTICISQDVSGVLYPVYDFDKLWDLIHNIDYEKLDKLARHETTYPDYQKYTLEKAVEMSYKSGYIRAKKE